MDDIENRLQRELDKLNEEIEKEHKQQKMPDLQLMLERDSRRLLLERKLSKLKGIEYAEPLEIDLPVGFDWHAAFSFRGDSYLLCDLSGEANNLYKSVVIRFINAMEARFGGLNDEVFDQHPLYGKGLDICGFFLIQNSSWKLSLQEKMQTHSCYDADLWSSIKHYLFRDKGGEIACLATNLEHWFSKNSIDDLRLKIIDLMKEPSGNVTV